MALTRHQRAMEKMEAVRARKRMQAAKSTIEANEKSQLSDDVVVTSKASEENAASASPSMVEDNKNTNNAAETQLDSILQEAESLMIDSKEMLCADIDDGARGLMEESAERRELIADVRSPTRKVWRKSVDGDRTPRSKTVALGRQSPTRGTSINSSRTNKSESPVRRRTASRKISLKKGSSDSKRPLKDKMSKRVRIREDDASTVDSNIESYLNDLDTDGVASALDQVLNFLSPIEDARSVGDDSYCSQRSERTEESAGFIGSLFATTTHKGGILKDMEDLFLEHFDCSEPAHDLSIPSYSFPEDDSTLSDRKEQHNATKREDDSTLSDCKDGRHVTKGRSSANLKHRKETPLRDDEVSSPILYEGDLSSIAPDDEDTEGYTDTSFATKEETKGGVESSKGGNRQNGFPLIERASNFIGSITEGRIANVTSFDTFENGIGCRNACDVNSSLCERSCATCAQKDGESNIQEFVENARRHAAKVTMASDASFQTFQTSWRDTASLASTYLSSIRDAATVTDASTKPNTTSTSSLLSSASGQSTVETRSVVQKEDNKELEGPAIKSDKGKLRHVDDENENDNDKTDEDMYAAGQTIIPSTSFYSVETGESPKKDALPTIQEAFAKLREIKAPQAIKKLQEIQTGLQDINLTSAERGSILERVQRVLSCSSEPDMNHSFESQCEVETFEDEQISQKIQQVLFCTEQNRNDTVLTSERIDIVEEVLLNANEDSLEQWTTVIVGDPNDEKELFETPRTTTEPKEEPTATEEVTSEADETPLDPVDFNANSATDPVKDCVEVGREVDCQSLSGNGSVDTKSTSTSTEDEASNPALDQKCYETRTLPPQTTPRRVVAPQAAHMVDAMKPQVRVEEASAEIEEEVSRDKPPPKEPFLPSTKWGTLRRATTIVRPMFRTKKHRSIRSPEYKSSSLEKPAKSTNFDSDSLKLTSDSGWKSLTAALPPEQSSPARGGVEACPFDPSNSTKAKREAWRSTRMDLSPSGVDEFTEIISANARTDDWDDFTGIISSKARMDDWDNFTSNAGTDPSFTNPQRTKIVTKVTQDNTWDTEQGRWDDSTKASF